MKKIMFKSKKTKRSNFKILRKDNKILPGASVHVLSMIEILDKKLDVFGA